LRIIPESSPIGQWTLN
jgi:RNA polymerase sigma-70 factor, ECF subfamily